MVKKSTIAIVILGLLFVGTLLAWMETAVNYRELKDRFAKLESAYAELKADYEELKSSYAKLKAEYGVEGETEETELEVGMVILDVPFVRQKKEYCSEASASMVLKYYGYDLSQDDIHDMGYDVFENMLPLLSRYIPCEYKSLTIEDLKEEIDEGDPVILRIRPGWPRHTIVVVGYDSNYIYVHDPGIGPNLPVKPLDLLRVWWPTNRMAIVFIP